MPDLESLRNTEMNYEFINLMGGRIDLMNREEKEKARQFVHYMNNRLIFGAFRYGLLQDPGKPDWDRMTSLRKRIGQYEEDGNAEWLVDAGNMALLEYSEGNHAGLWEEDGVADCGDSGVFDRIKSLKYSIAVYESSCNTRYLVDIANLSLLEFLRGDHNDISAQGDHDCRTEAVNS